MNPYVGRYAPSPTGRLHDGNLRTAALAWADARAHGGRFLMRMEDLDTPRVVDGAADLILEDLTALGLDWDGPVLWQSERIQAYKQALDVLIEKGLAFFCKCSRRDIQAASSAPHGRDTLIYPGTCKVMSKVVLEAQMAPGRSLATRFDVSELPPEHISDRALGKWQEELSSEVGAFVLSRADGVFAYQLACVVDDLATGVTDVVRGADLVSSCGRQQVLWRVLGGRAPRWFHLPLVKAANGMKLSKRDRRWEDVPLDGQSALGRFAVDLGWVPPGSGGSTPPITAPEFLSLYKDHPLETWP